MLPPHHVAKRHPFRRPRFKHFLIENNWSRAVSFCSTVGIRILFYSLLLSAASPDCDFDEGMCDWDAQEGWILDKRTRLVNLFEKRGKMILLCGMFRNVFLCRTSYYDKLLEASYHWNKKTADAR